MKHTLILTACVMALAGCASTPQTTQQRIAATCEAIASAEDALALVSDRLTPAQRDLVHRAIAIKAPICNVAPFPTTLTDAGYQALTSALASLTTVKQEAAR